MRFEFIIALAGASLPVSFICIARVFSVTVFFLYEIKH